MMTAITPDNLIAYVLQSSAVIAAALGALWLLRIDAANVRYLALRVTLAAALLLPLMQPRIAISEPVIRPASARQPPAVERVGSQDVRRFSVGPTPLVRVPSSAIVGAVLAFGALARLLWLGLGLWRLQWLRRLGETAVGEEYTDLANTIGAGAEMRYVAGLGQPLTFGFHRPLILLPESLRGLPENIRRAVVAHELWHVRRRDWIFMIAEEAVRAAFWFHPAMWALLSRIQVAREETVDELAVLATGSRRAYLDALLAFADARPLFATTAFARRRHLIHRILMISKESVMSSKRLVFCCGAFALAVAGTAWSVVAAFPLTTQQPPPRDPGLRSGQAHETAFVAASEADMQEAIRRDPKNPARYRMLANYYIKAGDFDRAISTLESMALADPTNAQHPHMIAVFYWEKASRDSTLSPDQKVTYLNAGIAASDRALAIAPDYAEAMTYKNILLRTLATYTTDASDRRRMMDEADTLRARAIELMKQRGTPAGAAVTEMHAMPPPPPPAPPPFGPVDGAMPLRVGGNIAAPAKIKDVRPEYPAVARAAGVAGVVILEAIIDTNGQIRDARVLRSIPLLDEAALDAVKQWQFAPTLLNNAPVPVIMTLSVHFSLQ